MSAHPIPRIPFDPQLHLIRTAANSVLHDPESGRRAYHNIESARHEVYKALRDSRPADARAWLVSLRAAVLLNMAGNPLQPDTLAAVDQITEGVSHAC